MVLSRNVCYRNDTNYNIIVAKSVSALFTRKKSPEHCYVPNVVENSKYYKIGQIKIWDDYYPNLIISKTKI